MSGIIGGAGSESGVIGQDNEVDQWRVHTTQNGSAIEFPLDGDIWERVDYAIQPSAKIGTGMDYDTSTGLFTFPSSGKWLVRFVGVCYITSGYLSRFNEGQISAGDDSILAMFNQQVGPTDDQVAASHLATGVTETIARITDTTSSAYKIKFLCQNERDDTFWQGSSTCNYTFATFMKLGGL